MIAQLEIKLNDKPEIKLRITQLRDYLKDKPEIKLNDNLVEIK